MVVILNKVFKKEFKNIKNIFYNFCRMIKQKENVKFVREIIAD